MFKYLLESKQLSIYWLFASLVVSAALMHPRVSTLLFAVPINAIILFGMRWAAHKEGRLMVRRERDYPAAPTGAV